MAFPFGQVSGIYTNPTGNLLPSVKIERVGIQLSPGAKFNLKLQGSDSVEMTMNTRGIYEITAPIEELSITSAKINSFYIIDYKEVQGG